MAAFFESLRRLVVATLVVAVLYVLLGIAALGLAMHMEGTGWLPAGSVATRIPELGVAGVLALPWASAVLVAFSITSFGAWWAWERVARRRQVPQGPRPDRSMFSTNARRVLRRFTWPGSRPKKV